MQDRTLPPLIGKSVMLRALSNTKFNYTFGRVLKFDYDKNRFLVETDIAGLKFIKGSNCQITESVTVRDPNAGSVLWSKIKALGEATKYKEGVKILNWFKKNRSIENTSEVEFIEKINFYERMTFVETENYIFDPKMQRKFIQALEILVNQTTHFPYAHLLAKIQLVKAQKAISSNSEQAYDILAPHLEHHYGLLPKISAVLLSFDSHHHIEKYMDLYYRTKECVASENYALPCRQTMDDFYLGGIKVLSMARDMTGQDKQKIHSELDFLRSIVLKNGIEDHYPIAYSYFVQKNEKAEQCLYHSKKALKWRSENGRFNANDQLLAFMFWSHLWLRNKEGAKKCLKQLKKIRPIDREMKLFNLANKKQHYWNENSNNESTDVERNLRQCGYFYCKNIESRKGEFNKCNACKVVYYCSRKCQKKHWKNGHKKECKMSKKTQEN